MSNIVDIFLLILGSSVLLAAIVTGVSIITSERKIRKDAKEALDRISQSGERVRRTLEKLEKSLSEAEECCGFDTDHDHQKGERH